MSVSKLLNNKEEYLKDAIQTGIDAETVNSTLDDMITKSNEKGATPKQAIEVVESIVEMKKNTENVIYIETNSYIKDSKYLENPHSYYPNTKGYQQISSKILSKIGKKLEKT